MTEPLVNGGQFAPQSGGSGAGTIYINARWQFNANALYQAPYGLELSANVFGRQGYPYPIVRSGTAAALGADSALTVLLSPRSTRSAIRTCGTPTCGSRARSRRPRPNIRLILDVFNLLNANTALVRVNDITRPLQRAGAEPEPAYRAGRRGGGVLISSQLPAPSCPAPAPSWDLAAPSSPLRFTKRTAPRRIKRLSTGSARTARSASGSIAEITR